MMNSEKLVRSILTGIKYDIYIARIVIIIIFLSVVPKETSDEAEFDCGTNNHNDILWCV